MSHPVDRIGAYQTVCTNFVFGLNRKIFMKHREKEDNYYNEESNNRRIPNYGREELDIEPLDWSDM